MVKRLAWSGLVAGVGALASIVTTRVAAIATPAQKREINSRSKLFAIAQTRFIRM